MNVPPRPARMVEGRLACFALFAVLGFAGCGSNERAKSRQVNGQCPSSVNPSGSAGAVCLDPLECQEYCCDCAAPPGGYAAQACIDDKCADRAAACAAALKAQPAICP